MDHRPIICTNVTTITVFIYCCDTMNFTHGGSIKFFQFNSSRFRFMLFLLPNIYPSSTLLTLAKSG